MGRRILPAILLPLAVLLAWTLCVRDGFVPFQLSWSSDDAGARATLRMDGRRIGAPEAGPAGAELTLPPAASLPASAVEIRLAGANQTGGSAPVRIRIHGESVPSLALPPDGKEARSVALLRKPATGRLQLELEAPPGAALSRLVIRNTLASHPGPAGIFLLPGRGGPWTEPVGLPTAAAAGFTVLAILGLYGMLLRAAARRGWAEPAPPFPAGAAGAASAPSVAVLLPTLASPWPVVMTGRALLLATGWALAGGILWDLLRRRAEAVRMRGTEEERARFRRRRSALLLSGAAFAAYNADFASHDQVDAIPCPYAALSLARELDFGLEEFPMLRNVTRPIASVDSPVIERPDGWVSKYPPGGAILSSPVLLLADLAGLARPESRRAMLFLGKLAASMYVAASVGLLYLALLRLELPRAGLWASIYAFGTAAFSVSSQSAWQHGFAQCMLAASVLLALGKGEGARRGIALGALLAMLALCRPVDALFSGAILLFALRRGARQGGWMLAGAAPFVLLQAAYNARYFGHVLATGYGPELSRFATPLWTGLAGLAASPSRGLFVYSPVLLLSLAGVWRAWRRREPDEGTLLLRWLSLGCAGFAAVMAKWSAWDGGWCFGNRMLADAVPALVLLAAAGAAPLERHRTFRVALGAAAALSIAVHATGVFFHNDRWNADPRSSPWSLRETQLESYLRYAREKFSERL